MSHFSQIRTKIRNLSSLKSALTDLEVGWKPGPQKVRGYRNQTHEAEIAIEQENGYDIGFCKNSETNEYELVADLQFWQQPWSVDSFLNRVTQRYAYHTVMGETARQGFEVAEQQQNKDGSIRFVLQRWSS